VRQALKVAFESVAHRSRADVEITRLLIHGDDDRTVDFHQTVDSRTPAPRERRKSREPGSA